MKAGLSSNTCLIMAAAAFLCGCGTVKDNVLIAYPDRPLLPAGQAALIDWGVKGEHDLFRRQNHQFHLLRINGYDAVNLGTWNGYKQMAVKPGLTTVSGNLIMDGHVTRTVRLQGGHEYELLQVPFIQHGGRVMTPEECAPVALSALVRAVPSLAGAESETHKMLLGYFYSPTLNINSDKPEFLDTLKNFRCRGLLVVKDRTTGSIFTAEDEESRRVFSILRAQVPRLIEQVRQPIILLPAVKKV